MNHYYIVKKDDELYHYGVPGMKWGIRRAEKLKDEAARTRRLRRVYERSSAHLNKIASKYEAKAAKADKHYDKASRKMKNVFRSSEEKEKKGGKQVKIADKANRSRAKQAEKGAKFYKEMEKAFGEKKLNMISKNDIKIGERLVNARSSRKMTNIAVTQYNSIKAQNTYYNRAKLERKVFG